MKARAALLIFAAILDFRAAMLEDFDAYHPDLKHVIRRVLSDLASKTMANVYLQYCG
jgi:hypothetical protein